ncbi:hypothetical protein BJX63DRAFT_432638 [Aspergillus granulosus]|uniref:Uncharacterized protein n=1 Tax=Aspergillus granulosus TaxID=176169 RepID=A0ABR4HA73_9EURO
MLKIFHDIPPALDEGGYDLILENCQALVELGEDIQASDIVSRALSTALHSLDQQICRLITQDPVSWVKLAVHIQCGSVFQESMIHLVGKWGLLGEKDRNSLPVSIRDISNRKLGRLNEIKKAVELQIVNHVPRPRSSLNLHRETSNVYAWIAVTHYQQWLCQSFIEGRNYRAPDGGASLYRAIALGDAYLNKLGHAISPLPTAEIGDEGKRGLREFERGLNELKNSIKGFVSDLLANYAKYDPDIFGELPYLTCCQVREEEMPAKPETVKTIYKTAETRITNVNSNFMHGNNLQHNFLNDPMSNCVQLPTTMMGYRSHANNYYPTDGMQDHFGFDESNIMQQWGVNWTGTVGFSNAAPALPMPSLVDMTTGIYRTQLDEDGNFEEIDVFGIIPTAETEKNLQNDESVTFI